MEVPARSRDDARNSGRTTMDSTRKLWIAHSVETQQAAAERMGISLSGMKSRVQRGRKQLKQLLDECCLIELDRRGGVRGVEVRDTGCDPCQSLPARSCR